MPDYQTPGVYFERVDAAFPAITALRTDIAAFVGIAERGPLHQAMALRSWRQFQASFGNFIPGGYLAYMVKAFFENGGRKCYAVRVADSSAAASAQVTIQDTAGNPAWIIQASSPGVWGNQLAVRLQTTHRAQTQTMVETDSVDQSSSHVASMAHFEVGTLVRLSQSNVSTLRVVAGLDGERQRLKWDAPLPSAFAAAEPILVQSVEYTLIVFYRGEVAAIYENLSLVPQSQNYAPDVVCFPTVNRNDSRDDLFPPAPPFVLVSPNVAIGQTFGSPSSIQDLAEDTTEPQFLTGGADGLETLAVDDFIGEPADLLGDDGEEQAKRRGLRALETVKEVSIVSAPDILIQPAPPLVSAPLPPCPYDPCLGTLVPPAMVVPVVVAEQPPIFSDADIFRVQSALIAHCEEQANRVAVIDPPYNAVREDGRGTGAVIAWRSRFDSEYAALYYPWLRVPDPLQPGMLVRDVPACGHVAGLYAQTDRDVGVHKAPANTPLQWVQDTTALVDSATQGVLNPRGINAIRSFPGRGIRVYGARTMSSDQDWRFINIRRLMLMIEAALADSTQWTVFEPNDVYTRSKVSLAIKSFLEALWRRGALAGAQPEQAFYVKCDEDNNPPDERDLGHFHVDIGVAPSQPGEFIIVRLGRTAGELEMTEP